MMEEKKRTAGGTSLVPSHFINTETPEVFRRRLDEAVKRCADR